MSDNDLIDMSNFELNSQDQLLIQSWEEGLTDPKSQDSQDFKTLIDKWNKNLEYAQRSSFISTQTSQDRLADRSV